MYYFVVFVLCCMCVFKDEEEEEEEDSDEDDTAELLRELQKIKRERAEEATRRDRERKEEEERIRTENLMRGNPLLNQEKGNFKVKRRQDAPFFSLDLFPPLSIPFLSLSLPPCIWHIVHIHVHATVRIKSCFQQKIWLNIVSHRQKHLLVYS